MNKQLLTFLILTAVLVSCLSVFAQEPLAQPSTEPENIWFMLDEEQTVLTIILPANVTTGYEWTYEISDPRILECTNENYVPYENKNKMVGVGGTWLADFKGTAKGAGDAEITLSYKRAWEDEAAQTRLVKVIVFDNGKLEIVSGEIIFPMQECAE